MWNALTPRITIQRPREGAQGQEIVDIQLDSAPLILLRFLLFELVFLQEEIFLLFDFALIFLMWNDCGATRMTNEEEHEQQHFSVSHSCSLALVLFLANYQPRY